MTTLESHHLLIPRDVVSRYLCVTKDELYVAKVIVNLEVQIRLP